MSHECAITRLLRASIFSFLGMEFIRSWAKKKKKKGSRRRHRHMFYIQFPDNMLLIQNYLNLGKDGRDGRDCRSGAKVVVVCFLVQL